MTRIFRSRWSALFWSAGVLWSAYSLVPAPNDASSSNGSDAAGEAMSNQDLAVIAAALDHER